MAPEHGAANAAQADMGKAPWRAGPEPGGAGVDPGSNPAGEGLPNDASSSEGASSPEAPVAAKPRRPALRRPARTGLGLGLGVEPDRKPPADAGHPVQAQEPEQVPARAPAACGKRAKPPAAADPNPKPAKRRAAAAPAPDAQDRDAGHEPVAGASKEPQEQPRRRRAAKRGAAPPPGDPSEPAAEPGPGPDGNEAPDDAAPPKVPTGAGEGARDAAAAPPHPAAPAGAAPGSRLGRPTGVSKIDLLTVWGTPALGSGAHLVWALVTARSLQVQRAAIFVWLCEQ